MTSESSLEPPTLESKEQPDALAQNDSVLQLSPREKVLGKYMPGDAFLNSLAADRRHKAIAVVLSGGDGDGSLGLTAIKVAGGVTFAQCEDTAKFGFIRSRFAC
jgi:chemotaxis response regulator CheB